MSRIRTTLGVRRTVAAGLALVLTLSVAAAAMAQDPPPPIAVEVLTPQRAVFTDDVSIQLKNKLDGRRSEVLNLKDPSRTLVARFTVQPGAQFPWHLHPGPVIVNVAQGELVYVQAEDCVERSYPAGTAFIDPGSNVHTAYNPTAGVTILVATFFDFPETGPLSITDVTPGDCQIDVGTHASH